TKVIINSQVKLPKLHTKGDYKAWCSEVPLHFDSRMLCDITYGPERYDEQEGMHEIRDNMNATTMLYERITQHFESTARANCQGEGHWYSECTEKTGIPLRADLAAKLAQRKKMKSQKTKQPVSLVNLVRRVEVVGSGRHGLSAGLCQPSSSADTIYLTCHDDQGAASPVYSATTQPSSDDEESMCPTAVRVHTNLVLALLLVQTYLRRHSSCSCSQVLLLAIRVLMAKDTCNSTRRQLYRLLCRVVCRTSGRAPYRKGSRRTGTRYCTTWAKDSCSMRGCSRLSQGITRVDHE
ncbi:hypothetical protein PHMEG_00030265, partial [Phytophthora megakarya]